jgi:hypothetical protein
MALLRVGLACCLVLVVAETLCKAVAAAVGAAPTPGVVMH